MKLLIAPKVNIRGKKDATGAFHPEAHAFSKAHGGNTLLRLFDNTTTMADRFIEVTRWIESITPGTVDTVAVFCHGYKTGLQFGATIRNVDLLAKAIGRACAPSPRIVLYACDAARDADLEWRDDMQAGPGGEGGYADRLRHALRARNVNATIYAHATTGHTTHNPYLRRFDPSDLAGGHWVITPHSALWCAWIRALRGSMRFRFPYLSQREIEAELVPDLVA